MFKVFQYRLYPTKAQTEALVSQLNGHRYLYNKALEQRKNIYEQTGEGVGYCLQAKMLIPELRGTSDVVALCNYSSLQQTLRRLDKAFKSFFRRVKSGNKPGYPRFKAHDRFNTIDYARIGDGCQIKGDRLYLQNIGLVKVKWHRPVEGDIENVSITRRNDKWYSSFLVETEPIYLPLTGKVIGIDVGLSHFITTTEGEQVDAPKCFRQSEKKLAKAQRKLARRKKGSNRRKKARKLVAKQHEKIANQRLDFCHKLTHDLVQRYDGFAVEDLNIQNMVKNRHLSKSISDVAWGQFLLILKSKAENAGRKYQEVNPAYTSQECSSCTKIVKKTLAIRIHNCPHCGLYMDRDQNAALNILARTGPSWRSDVGRSVEARSRRL
jgi:putative transposase